VGTQSREHVLLLCVHGAEVREAIKKNMAVVNQKMAEAGVHSLYGILSAGGPWGDGCSGAVAAPTAVSSGLVHLVGLQSRHTPQKVR